MALLQFHRNQSTIKSIYVALKHLLVFRSGNGITTLRRLHLHLICTVAARKSSRPFLCKRIVKQIILL